MKQLKRYIDPKDQSGYVGLRLEDDEDVWHAYNLINEGDEVRASAVRRITSETATGSTDSHRIRLNLSIQVKKIAYSAAPSADGAPAAGSSGGGAPVGGGPAGGATLHLSGPICEPSPHVKMGAFHTLDLEPGRDFTVTKGPGGWDVIDLDRVREATDVVRGAEIGAVVCGEGGRATVCVIGQHTTVVKQRIEVAVPRKRKGGAQAAGADKAMTRYYRQIYEAILRHFELEKLKIIILASPGFVKDAVYDWIFAEAVRTNTKQLIIAKPRFKRLHSPSPHVHSLTEVLSSPEVSMQLKDTKYAQEGLALDRFHKMLGNDELRAWYGEDHVFRAAERGAVGTLLITDGLFKNSDPVKRKRFVQLTEDVKKFGGEVFIFSSMHESGARLGELTGVAAILTFPLDIEVVEEEDRLEKEQAEKATRAGSEAGEEAIPVNPNGAGR